MPFKSIHIHSILKKDWQKRVPERRILTSLVRLKYKSGG